MEYKPQERRNLERPSKRRSANIETGNVMPEDCDNEQ
jgi:hypothetical protein